VFAHANDSETAPFSRSPPQKPLNRRQAKSRWISAPALQLIVDNYATHKRAKVRKWLKRHPRFHIHFIPTSSSWLNVVERWFRDLTQKRIRNDVFRRVAPLERAITDYIAHHNARPKPFVWTTKAADLLEKSPAHVKPSIRSHLRETLH
jgi:transposase